MDIVYLVKLVSNGGFVCEVSLDVIEVAYCAFWMHFTKDNIEMSAECNTKRYRMRKCFNLKNETSSTTTTRVSKLLDSGADRLQIKVIDNLYLDSDL